MTNEKVDLNKLNQMYFSFSVTLKSNTSNFNNKKLSSKMYKPEIKTLSTTLKDSNFKDMFLKSVKKQDVEIVTKFRNLISKIDERLNLVNKKIKEIEDGEVKDRGNPASQEKIDVLRGILEEPTKTLDDMEMEIKATTSTARKSISVLKEIKQTEDKQANVKEKIKASISKKTLYSILKDIISSKLEEDAIKDIGLQLQGQNNMLSFYKQESSLPKKKELSEKLYQLHSFINGKLESLSNSTNNEKTDITEIINKTQEISNLITEIARDDKAKLLASGKNTLRQLVDSFLETLKKSLEDLKTPPQETLKLQFKDIKGYLEGNTDKFQQDKNQLVELLTNLHPLLQRLFTSENSESVRLKPNKSEDFVSERSRMSRETDDLKSFITSQIGDRGIYGKENLKEFREAITKYVIKSPLVEDSEFRYDNVERLDLCAKELSDSLSGTVFSVPIYLPINNKTLDELVGKSLTPDERVALITSNMASLNMIVKDRQTFRRALKEIEEARGQSDNNEKRKQLENKIIRRYVGDNIKYVIKTLVSKDTILVDGDSYKVNSVTLPSTLKIQTALDKNSSSIFKNSQEDFKCEEKVDADVMETEVNITLYSDKLTSKQIKSKKCKTQKKRIKVYTDYLLDVTSEYKDIEPTNILDKLESFVNR